MKSGTTLAVYCGSSVGTRRDYVTAAREVGQRCAREGVRVVCGGARVGLMGELTEATTAAGGKVTGVLPGFLAELEPPAPGLTDLVVVDTMHQRKAVMMDRADAFLALPGGLGTLEEISEAMTLHQLGRHTKPVVFLNTAGYWTPLLELLRSMQDEGFFVLDGRRTIQLADDLGQAWELLR